MAALDEVWEGQTAIYNAMLIDEEGDPVSSAILATATLTWFSLRENESVNGRLDQDVLNNNDVTIDMSGNLEWKLGTLDTTMIDDPKPTKATHRGRFTFTWLDAQSVQRVHIHKFDLTIKHNEEVSAPS